MCLICSSQDCNCVVALEKVIEKVLAALLLENATVDEEFYCELLGLGEPVPSPRLATAIGWATKFDQLYGYYEERPIEDFKGICFKCGLFISGAAAEKRRGGSSWFVHAVCPIPSRKKKGRVP